jgi:hypothetical protein
VTTPQDAKESPAEAGLSQLDSLKVAVSQTTRWYLYESVGGVYGAGAEVDCGPRRFEISNTLKN